jgi:leucyl-tRNA synthetase
LRYMDAHNESEFVSKETMEYWGNVDLYIGGSEHATGHLLYARFWHKFLADMCLVNTQEPFQKLINQGMIQGVSAFVYRVKGKNKFVSKGLKNEYDTAAIHADLSHVDGDHLNVEAFKNWRAEFKDAEFVLEDGKYIVGHEVEKMSKSKYNVVNPDDVITQYGADALRMYEMFLGPLEQSKPWSTQGLSGVNGFFKKFWRLFQNGISDEKATAAELKALHTCIKKVNEDIENFSFNTSVAAFMICANELNDLKCKKRPVLEPLAVLISPFAPHMAEELWSILEHTEGISRAAFPTHEQKFLIESSKNYPVSFNGKMRFTIDLPLDLKKEEIEKAVMAHEKTAGYIEGKTIRKVIIVPGKIINIVVG